MSLTVKILLRSFSFCKFDFKTSAAIPVLFLLAVHDIFKSKVKIIILYQEKRTTSQNVFKHKFCNIISIKRTIAVVDAKVLKDKYTL